MLTCETCGCTEFDKHDGYMYCTECQTQTQDYREQEHEYVANAQATAMKSHFKKLKKTDELKPEDLWTSWEAFNCILYGMTMELKAIGVPDDFENLVLKLWAWYLNKYEVAFISRYKDEKPKLGIMYRQRDAVVLNCSFQTSKRKRSGSSSTRSKTASSRRSLKKRLMAMEYEKYSQSIASSSLADETLESLGRSSDASSMTSNEMSKSIRSFFRSDIAKLYSTCEKNPSRRRLIKESEKKKLGYLSKAKLFAILFIGLVISGSEIQLSDLIRFVKEGFLSYAKVTHFLPQHYKFMAGDARYIETTVHSSMPAHRSQRKLIRNFLYMLGIIEIPFPDIKGLINRYTEDLNLPDAIAKYSKRVFALTRNQKTTVNLSRCAMYPSFEAMAMACIIFTLKLLFRLDDEVELSLSKFAEQVNRLQTKKNNPQLFVFTDWQKHLECRKTVLNDFHYPTEERLNRNCYNSTKNLIDALSKESKDENRSLRFRASNCNYSVRKCVESAQECVSGIAEEHHSSVINFPCSFTPQTSCLQSILQARLDCENRGDNNSIAYKLLEINNLGWKILNQNFRKCTVDFAIDVQKYSKDLGEVYCVRDVMMDLNRIIIIEGLKTKHPWHRFKGGKESTTKRRSRNSNTVSKLTYDYWVLTYPTRDSKVLKNFVREVLGRTSKNFKWIISLCAQMLEINSRELYEELLRVEVQVFRKF